MALTLRNPKSETKNRCLALCLILCRHQIRRYRQIECIHHHISLYPFAAHCDQTDSIAQGCKITFFIQNRKSLRFKLEQLLESKGKINLNTFTEWSYNKTFIKVIGNRTGPDVSTTLTTTRTKVEVGMDAIVPQTGIWVTWRAIWHLLMWIASAGPDNGSCFSCIVPGMVSQPLCTYANLR